MLAGVGVAEAHEYAIALGLMIAGAASLVFSAFHWKGINGWPRLIKISRICIFVFGVLLLPTSVVWISNIKGNNPWSQIYLGVTKPEPKTAPLKTAQNSGKSVSSPTNEALQESAKPLLPVEPTKVESPTEQKKEDQPTPKTATAKIRPKDEPKLTEKPYFAIEEPQILKATSELKSQFGSNYVVLVKVVNKGKHTADNLYSRYITIDQNFQKRPTIIDWSNANDFPTGTFYYHYAPVPFHLGEILPPSYLVFAIKYEDKETPTPKTFYQIWYFKQPKGTDKEPPFHILETSIPEREDINKHLMQELSDYTPSEVKKKKESQKETTKTDHIPEVQKILPPKDSLGRVMVSVKDNPRRICKNHPVDDFSRQLGDKLKISVLTARKENNKQFVDGTLSIVQAGQETKLEKFTSVEVGACMIYEIYSIRVPDIFSDHECAVFQVSLNEMPPCQEPK
jgi:hypothetical protein